MLKRFLLVVVALNMFGCISLKEKVKHNNSLHSGKKAKYVFLFIGDGMGASHRLLGEKAFASKLYMNTLATNALVSTSPYGGGITDSAASATAFACGKKTKNKAIGLDHEDKPIESVATMAKKLGWKVGIVSSVPLNHATPAAFYAHRLKRYMYNEIIQDMAVSDFDYFGGSSLIVKTKNKDAKQNKKEILECLKDNNYIMIKAEKKMPKLNPNKKYIIHSYVPNELEREKKSALSLADYTALGIKHLYAGAGRTKGFFMMVEGGKIDWCSHGHDGGGMIHEVKAFDVAIKVALDFYKKHPESTTIIVTSDHETGGLHLLPDVNPADLLQQKHSYAYMNSKINKYKKEQLSFEKVLPLLKDNYGIKRFSSQEIEKINKAWNSKKNKYKSLLLCIQRIFNERCGLKWTTGGHTSADVPLNAIGVGASIFSAYYENNQIANKLKSLIKPVAKK
jgi:alkaline phosphatase